MSFATSAAFSSVVAEAGSTSVALSGTPCLSASRRMISPELTDSGSIAAPEKTMTGAQPAFHSVTAVSARAPVSPEIATIASTFSSGSSTASQLPIKRNAVRPVPTLSTTPTSTPTRNFRMTRGYSERRVWGSGGRRGGCGRWRAAACLEALRAVHRSISARLEWHLCLLAAVAADDLVHVGCAGGGALGLRLLAAIHAALRLVEQTLLLVELLLPRRPYESVAALAAAERSVLEGDGHRLAFRAESYAAPSRGQAAGGRRQADAAVRRNPSSSPVRDRQSPSRFAREESMHERCSSPWRSGAFVMPAGGPRISAIAAMSSFTLVGTPVPML